MDEDIEQMSREQLVAEVKRLRQGIRQHRDSSGHELCGPPSSVGAAPRRRLTRSPQCRTGRSSCKVASDTGSRLMNSTACPADVGVVRTVSVSRLRV